MSKMRKNRKFYLLSFYLLSVALLGMLLVAGYLAKQVSGLAWQLVHAQVQVNGRTTSAWAIYQTTDGDFLVMSPRREVYRILGMESRIIRVSNTGMRVGKIWVFCPATGVPMDGSSAKADFFNAQLNRSDQQMCFITPEGDIISIRLK
ncbi:MAG: hypothetical protein ABIN58_08305 [candidate division WOR-3 bacterium]